MNVAMVNVIRRNRGERLMEKSDGGMLVLLLFLFLEPLLMILRPVMVLDSFLDCRDMPILGCDDSDQLQ